MDAITNKWHSLPRTIQLSIIFAVGAFTPIVGVMLFFMKAWTSFVLGSVFGIVSFMLGLLSWKGLLLTTVAVVAWYRIPRYAQLRIILTDGPAHWWKCEKACRAFALNTVEHTNDPFCECYECSLWEDYR